MKINWNTVKTYALAITAAIAINAPTFYHIGKNNERKLHENDKTIISIDSYTSHEGRVRYNIHGIYKNEQFSVLSLELVNQYSSNLLSKENKLQRWSTFEERGKQLEEYIQEESIWKEFNTGEHFTLNVEYNGSPRIIVMPRK